MIKVSLIIPVFNAEKYLKRCVKSLLGQSLIDCEFIFVNDGSTDNSVSIIEDYQKIDERVKLISQQNQGVSAARNKGIEIAKGTFIGFIDADDIVEPIMFEKLYQAAISNETDLVSCNFSTHHTNTISTSDVPISTHKKLDKDFINKIIIPYFIKGTTLNACWNKLYKASIIKSISFPVGIPLGEDGIFNLKVFDAIQNCLFLDFVGYHYFENEGSATRNAVSKDYFKRALQVYHFNYQELIHYKLNENDVKLWKSKQLIENVVSYCYIYLQPNVSMSFINKLKYVNKMISDSNVQHAIQNYYNEIIHEKPLFQQKIINCIKNKSIIKLVTLIYYSSLRN